MMRQVWAVVMGAASGLAMCGLAACGRGAQVEGPPAGAGASPAAASAADAAEAAASGGEALASLLAAPRDPAEALVTGAFFDKGRAPILTGWEDTHPERLAATYCQGCHAQTHSQWRDGLHSRAWTDPLFQAALHSEEVLWCVHCHAPLAAQRDQYLDSKLVIGRAPNAGAYPDAHPDATALLDEGINCAACHVRAGQILGTRPSTNTAHAVVASAYLSSAAFCADCHQFNFPDLRGGHIRYTDAPMQDTYGEWLAASVGATCTGCHYRDGHRLTGPHDADWMRAKFKNFHVADEGTQLAVRFDVSPRGHWVPSGDLFHSLALEASDHPDFSALIIANRWARTFTTGPLDADTLWDRALHQNTGLRPEQRRVALTLDVPPGDGPLYVRLVYHYHDAALGGPRALDPDTLRLVLWQAQAR